MPSNKIILGFIGPLASGKGTLAKYLNEKYGCNAYRFSSMLRDVLKRLYVEPTRSNLQKVSQVLRENFGQDLMSKIIAEDVKNDANDLVVVDGVRRPTDITYLETNPAFHLVYVTADPHLRWERLVKRNENPGDDKKTFVEFSKDEQAEAEARIEALGKKTPLAITNDSTFDELYARLETILTKIKNES